MVQILLIYLGYSSHQHTKEKATAHTFFKKRGCFTSIEHLYTYLGSFYICFVGVLYVYLGSTFDMLLSSESIIGRGQVFNVFFFGSTNFLGLKNKKARDFFWNLLVIMVFRTL